MDRDILYKNEKINNLINALNYVCKEKHGRLDDLQTKISDSCIKELAAAGFIAYGETVSFSTWKITEYATDFQNSLSTKCTFKDKINNIICRYILKI